MTVGKKTSPVVRRGVRQGVAGGAGLPVHDGVDGARNAVPAAQGAGSPACCPAWPDQIEAGLLLRIICVALSRNIWIVVHGLLPNFSKYPIKEYI